MPTPGNSPPKNRFDHAHHRGTPPSSLSSVLPVRVQNIHTHKMDHDQGVYDESNKHGSNIADSIKRECAYFLKHLRPLGFKFKHVYAYCDNPEQLGRESGGIRQRTSLYLGQYFFLTGLGWAWLDWGGERALLCFLSNQLNSPHPPSPPLFAYVQTRQSHPT
jgi:hypothetical protein